MGFGIGPKRGGCGIFNLTQGKIFREGKGFWLNWGLVGWPLVVGGLLVPKPLDWFFTKLGWPTGKKGLLKEG